MWKGGVWDLLLLLHVRSGAHLQKFARDEGQVRAWLRLVKLLESRVWLARLHRDKNAWENVGLDPLNSIPPIAFNLIVRPAY